MVKNRREAEVGDKVRTADGSVGTCITNITSESLEAEKNIDPEDPAMQVIANCKNGWHVLRRFICSSRHRQ